MTRVKARRNWRITKVWGLFRAPRPAARSYQRYDLIFTILLCGSIGVFLSFFFLLVISYVVFENTHVFDRLLVCGVTLGYLGIVYAIWWTGRKWAAALLLVILYGLIAVVAIASWGINAPIGHLLLAITIVLAGILLGSRYALYAAAVAILSLMIVQIAVLNGYTPSESSALNSSHFGDVIGYGLLLVILAVISWMFGDQVERLLLQNQQAEEALLREKALLETRVEERTTELQAVQFEEMQYLYRFAEVGQLSTAVLHDLANHLTVLTFDIEDLDRDQHSGTLQRARHSIKYLDHMVKQAREQLQDTTKTRRFNVVTRIHKSLQIVSQKAKDQHVDLQIIAPKKHVLCVGDPARFNQIISILVTNSIDAYAALPQEEVLRKVVVEVEMKDKTVDIVVKDWGAGIPVSRHKRLFEPFHTTKKTGMGIGLFIARQLAVAHFKGLLTYTPHPVDCVTEFTFTFPKAP